MFKENVTTSLNTVITEYVTGFSSALSTARQVAMPVSAMAVSSINLRYSCPLSKSKTTEDTGSENSHRIAVNTMEARKENIREDTTTWSLSFFSV